MAVRRSTWYAFIRSLVRNAFFKLITGGIRSVGEENIPLEGALIVAPLHVSHLDPPAVACAQNRRQLTFMAKEELFKGIFGKLIRSLGAFPVRRGEGDTESIRRAIALLDEGRAVLVFPEGTRGDGVAIQPVNRGVSMLAKKTGAQVVPVGIIGTHVVMPKGRSKIKRHRITLAFGKPFTYAEVATDPSEKVNRERFAQLLQSRLVELCRENGMDLKTLPCTPGSEGSDSAGTTA